MADVEHAKDSKKIRAGKGKMRGRRFVSRRGPLVVYNEDHGLTKAFRNLPGVELCQVDRLNLLQLAPGAHLGRFVIWTKSAFERLDALWGGAKRLSSEKKDYHLPSNIMHNSDIARIINSDEVQSKVRPAVFKSRRAVLKKNPLKNLGAMVRLNPYALSVRRAELNSAQHRKQLREAAIEAKRKNLPVPEDKCLKAAKAAAMKHRSNSAKNFKRLNAD